MDLGAQHGANMHQKSMKKSIKKLIEICISFRLIFCWFLKARTFNFWWPSQLKPWFLTFLCTWILIDFWSIFWVILGPQTYLKPLKNRSKNQVNFDINFYWILYGFWRGFGGQDGSQIHVKSIKKRYQKNDRKMGPKKSRKCTQVYASWRVWLP